MRRTRAFEGLFTIFFSVVLLAQCFAFSQPITSGLGGYWKFDEAGSDALTPTPTLSDDFSADSGMWTYTGSARITATCIW